MGKIAFERPKRPLTEAEKDYNYRADMAKVRIHMAVARYEAKSHLQGAVPPNRLPIIPRPDVYPSTME